MEKNNYKKVVWPNRSPRKTVEQSDERHHVHQQESFGQTENHTTDHPMAWIKTAASEHHAQQTAEAMEMEIQKRVWDATTGRRLSRSRSRSKNIMDRARSFERAAAEAATPEIPGSNHGSRAPSRQGSSSNLKGLGRRPRSPSAGRQMADFWQSEAGQVSSRPPSRAAREKSVGRIDTSHWEAAMAKAKPQGPPPKTPPPRRRELKAPSPVPPPPLPPQVEDVPDHDPTPPLPPPPPPRNESSGGQELKSIQSLSPEEKEQIVDEWVQQTSTQQARDELERFALEIAETVVSTMEKHQVSCCSRCLKDRVLRHPLNCSSFFP